MTRTSEAQGGPDSLAYDLAGNVTERHTSRGHVIRMTYDALGRLIERIAPPVTYPFEAGALLGVGAPFHASGGLTLAADTATFGYDTCTVRPTPPRSTARGGRHSRRSSRRSAMWGGISPRPRGA